LEHIYPRTTFTRRLAKPIKLNDGGAAMRRKILWQGRLVASGGAVDVYQKKGALGEVVARAERGGGSAWVSLVE
jgi:hypothetical protein